MIRHFNNYSVQKKFVKIAKIDTKSKRVKFGCIFETFGRSRKGMWISSDRATKRGSILCFLETPFMITKLRICKNYDTNCCLKKPMKLCKLLTEIAS